MSEPNINTGRPPARRGSPLTRLRRLFRGWTRPGGGSRLSQRLDRWAATRTMEAFIQKTEDVQHVRWAGRPIWQYPLDAWVIQEVVSELRPDYIIETGTHRGGSAYYYATICDLIGNGRILSIDIAAQETIAHPRIEYLAGSSVDPAIVGRVADRIAGSRRTLVILDSDHRERHVRQELEMYAPLVQVGGYIHVQDGCIDTLDCLRGGRPGPAAAARSFLENHPEFIRDTDLEFRYVMTAHPFGWLRRVQGELAMQQDGVQSRNHRETDETQPAFQAT